MTAESKPDLQTIRLSEGVKADLKGVRVSSKTLEKQIDNNPNNRGLRHSRLREYGIRVAAIVEFATSPDATIDSVADEYQIPRESVVAALRFYGRNKLPIEDYIYTNRDGFGVPISQ